MVKRAKTLEGKRPSNTAGVTKARPVTNNPGKIRNKLKRSEMYGRYLLQKKAAKKDARKKRSIEAAELGEDAEKPKTVQKTLDNTREYEETMVRPDDDEVMADEAEDEFAQYFSDTVRPKLCITTRPRPSAELFQFIQNLITLIPNMYFYPRKSFTIKEIVKACEQKKFTHLLVLSEKSKVCNGMIISHLPAGPTAFFKVSNVIPGEVIPGHGQATSHVPELNLSGFGTRLGHRAGRFLGSLFPHNAEFEGRQVVTFHNQRDYIFVRHHRYVFHEGKEVDKEKGHKKTKARLQELGPRFTLKMRWLQEGTFDTQFGEYEWHHKRKEMDVSRRKFHL
mmetsp:Transcript_15653/g.24350  ORF Transcript_15653/g.24350 Transcript_15653/m.24350 type:complete len:336 (-) Transcript_15653:99-1106(-)|eukprot:CAMPEP_0196803014 /NCGR_PEP_ID=MMETSP1362-20130617/2480_1 /TAXON_ID=163516 /ORGANISM="Leptocylindrus danicus, Strain CCMP1856" /LENGTH=335 /DNA_ID=CAMNT_0042174435 /DNA_START=61 /DNA_END=1068 /DNA_ORIENTATION=-